MWQLVLGLVAIGLSFVLGYRIAAERERTRIMRNLKHIPVEIAVHLIRALDPDNK